MRELYLSYLKEAKSYSWFVRDSMVWPGFEVKLIDVPLVSLLQLPMRSVGGVTHAYIPRQYDGGVTL